jgi:alpha-tubulin suppressor-like RCC1 family protein
MGRSRGVCEHCRPCRFGPRGLRRWRVSLTVLAVGVGALGLSGCVADSPPIIGPATPGDGRAVVSWQAPLAAPAPITAYVVTPWIGPVRQTPVVFNSTATTQTLTGLTNGVTYTFTVHALNALGNDSASSGVSNPVIPGPHLALDGGGIHTCAVVTDGTVKCWGVNDFGQLGNGTTTDSSMPVAVTGITGATAISAGAEVHTCALLAGGTVKCWGRNQYGQLGNGTTTDSSMPVAVTGITGATAISAGDLHTCALLADGSIKCWGRNIAGELGNSSNTSSSTPVAVTGITDATAVTAGDFHTCALLAGGTLKCWGYNLSGRLGDGTTTHSSTPVTVTGITDATAVTAGGAHTCALVGGTVACWGHNSFGQLGNGTTTSSSTPMAVTGITDATAVTAGGAHTCGLRAGGTLKCWGDNFSGQLGNGTTADSSTPVAVAGITDATTISAGGYHTCALRAGGTVECWGNQLANGTLTNSSTPVTVFGI